MNSEQIKNRIVIVLVIIIGVLVLFLKCCKEGGSKCPPSTSDTITETDTIYDTTTVTIHSKPIVTTVTEWNTMWKYLPIDTQAILTDYHRLYIYTDTLENDTLYYIVITDSVTKNNIIGRGLEYKNLKASVINNTTITNIYETKHKIGIGGFVGMCGKIPTIGVSGEYIYNNKHSVDLKVGLNTTVLIGYKYMLFSFNSNDKKDSK